MEVYFIFFLILQFMNIISLLGDVKPLIPEEWKTYPKQVLSKHLKDYNIKNRNKFMYPYVSSATDLTTSHIVKPETTPPLCYKNDHNKTHPNIVVSMNKKKVSATENKKLQDIIKHEKQENNKKHKLKSIELHEISQKLDNYLSRIYVKADPEELNNINDNVNDTGEDNKVLDNYNNETVIEKPSNIIKSEKNSKDTNKIIPEEDDKNQSNTEIKNMKAIKIITNNSSMNISCNEIETKSHDNHTKCKSEIVVKQDMNDSRKDPGNNIIKSSDIYEEISHLPNNEIPDFNYQSKEQTTSINPREALLLDGESHVTNRYKNSLSGPDNYANVYQQVTNTIYDKFTTEPYPQCYAPSVPYTESIYPKAGKTYYPNDSIWNCLGNTGAIVKNISKNLKYSLKGNPKQRYLNKPYFINGYSDSNNQNDFKMYYPRY